MIKIENWQHTGRVVDWGSAGFRSEFGTVDVTIGSETRTVPANRETSSGVISIKVPGIAARMGRTGSKLWKAELVLWEATGNIAVYRTGNFRDPRGSGLQVVGFYDASASAKSLHSSQRNAK